MFEKSGTQTSESFFALIPSPRALLVPRIPGHSDYVALDALFAVLRTLDLDQPRSYRSTMKVRKEATAVPRFASKTG